MKHDNVALKEGLLSELPSGVHMVFTVAIGVQTTTTAVTVFYVELNPDLFFSLSDKLILITIARLQAINFGLRGTLSHSILLSTNTE